MVSGSCLCGQIGYQMDETEAANAFHCHCSDCQKITGSGKATVVEIPEAAIQISGEYSTYEKSGSDGSQVIRAFCPECGSQMFTFVREKRGFLFVKAGTLDSSDWIKPIASCWSSSASQWARPDKNIDSYEGNPPLA